MVMKAAIFRETVSLLDSSMVKSKIILKGGAKFFFFFGVQKETRVDLNFPVIYYTRVISRRWFS